METIDNIIKCNLCSNILDNPVLLPCGTTVCRKHIDEVKKQKEPTIHCYSCNQDHKLEPNTSYPPNKIVEALIKKRFDKLDFADFSDEYKNANRSLQLLKSAYENYEKTRTQPDQFVGEFFDGLIEDIELRRKELKDKIDATSDQLIEEIRTFHKRFEEDALTSSSLGENFQHIKSYIERSENNLNSFVINEEEWQSISSKSQNFEKLLVKQTEALEDELLYTKAKDFNQKYLNLNNIYYKALEFNQNDRDLFRFALKMLPEYAKLTDSKCFGNNNKPHIIKNLPFEVFVNLTPSSHHREVFLEIYVLSLFESKFKHWVLDVDYEFRLLSRFQDKIICKKNSSSFKAKSATRGFKELISFKDLMNKTNGYVDEDGFVNIEAYLRVRGLRFETVEPQQVERFIVKSPLIMSRLSDY